MTRRTSESGRARGPTAVALALLVALGTAGAPPMAHAGKQAAPPDLNGIWKLDESRSETLQQKMEEMRSSGSGMTGGGPPMGGGGPPMGGGGPPMGGGGPPMGGGGRPTGGSGGSDGEAPDDLGSARGPGMQPMAALPRTLAIEQSDSVVVLSERGTVLRTLLLGTAEQDSTRGPGSSVFRARWKGRRLEAEGASGRGSRARETYDLSKDGKVLTVTLRLPGPGDMGTLQLKQVYDRYEGD